MKLVAGKGAPGEGACWMSALSWYAGEEWSDMPECVDPLVALLGRYINDRLLDEERERVIGPHLMAPLGTAGVGEAERREVLTELGVRTWIPLHGRAERDVAVHTALRSMAPDLFRELDYGVGQKREICREICREIARGPGMELMLRLCAAGQRREVPQVRALEELA